MPEQAGRDLALRRARAQRIGHPENLDQPLDAALRRKKRGQKTPGPQQAPQPSKWQEPRFGASSDRIFHRVTEKHGPTAGKTAFLDVDANAPIAVREHGVLAAVLAGHDKKPACEAIMVEPVGISRIGGQRIDAQDIGIDARIPNEARAW